MKRTFIYQSVIMLGIITLTFSACKKDKNTDDGDITSVEENTQADENIADDLDEAVAVYATQPSAGIMSSPSGSKIAALAVVPNNFTCRTVTVTNPTNTTKVVTVDFGTTGCSSNGITIKGKKIFTFTGDFKTPGSTVTITLENFYINDRKIEGTKTITNSTTSITNPRFTVVVSRSKSTSTGGAVVSWEANRTVEIKDMGTPTDFADDELWITGSGSGTNSKGKAYTVTITNPLIKKRLCLFITKGTIEVKPEDRPVRTLDYGDGTCDNKAMVTVNGTTKEITLRK